MFQTFNFHFTLPLGLSKWAPTNIAPCKMDVIWATNILYVCIMLLSYLLIAMVNYVLTIHVYLLMLVRYTI